MSVVPTHVLQIGLAEAQAKRPPPGNLAVPLLRCADVEVEFYAPAGSDPQTPHTRDEAYVVIQGTGAFVIEGNRLPHIGPGDFLFAPAGVAHRFEDFSVDFAVWVLFYGPEGGER
jgi:mannose-6-phosphate isomerase-like protein (cupin superfamily)